MLFILIFILPICLFSQSMLSEAEQIGQRYAPLLSKLAPPAADPQTDSLLDLSSIWFSIDLTSLSSPKDSSILNLLTQDSFWDTLQDLHVQGLYLEGLKKGGTSQLKLSIDPKWGTQEWPKITKMAQSRHIALIGDTIGSSTGVGEDFELALKKVDPYPELYHLIEVDPQDWTLLPSVPLGARAANISWIKLQELSRKGYIPQKKQSFTKQTQWNATGKIKGTDGITRRWIYLKQNQNDPVLAWMTPSLATERLSFGDALTQVYQLGQKINCLDASLPAFSRQAQSLFVRKIGGFTVQKNSQTLEEIKLSSSDATTDTLTREAFLHALIGEDTQIVRLIYRLFLEEKIPIKSLVHSLQPFDEFGSDWTEFALNPEKNYLYKEEVITGEMLREKLLREDLFRIGEGKKKNRFASLPFVMEIKDFEKKKEEIQKVHELLAFTYAMQPGIFSFSAADVLGALPEQDQNLDLMGPNPQTLYLALSLQLRNPHSFASHLRKILSIRKSSNIAQGELVAVPSTAYPGSLLLVHRLPKSRFIQLLAVNFSRHPVRESLTSTALQHTSAIELLSSLTQEKVFDSDQFTFDLPPLSGKVFLFQPKYFD